MLGNGGLHFRNHHPKFGANQSFPKGKSYVKVLKSVGKHGKGGIKFVSAGKKTGGGVKCRRPIGVMTWALA